MYEATKQSKIRNYSSNDLKICHKLVSLNTTSADTSPVITCGGNDGNNSTFNFISKFSKKVNRVPQIGKTANDRTLHNDMKRKPPRKKESTHNQPNIRQTKLTSYLSVDKEGYNL